MYKSRELRDAEWRVLASKFGSEEIRGISIKGYPRRRQRKYVMPEWMFDDEIVRIFLDDHFPQWQCGTIKSFLQNHWKNHDHKYYQAAIWLRVISLWFRNGMSESRTAIEITEGRVAWLSRMRYKIDERNMKKVTVNPDQVAKIVEHIKNAARGWNPDGKTRAERIRNCPRRNGSPRTGPWGQTEDTNGNPVFLSGIMPWEEIKELLAKYGIHLRARPKHGRSRGRPRKPRPTQADTETK